ncbi:MAG: EF-hand domain-containing protein, partial [Planctomycetota bacterium]
HAVAVRTALACVALSGTASGQTIEWALPVDGNWIDSSAWSPSVVPGIGDVATVGLVGPYVVTVTGSQAIDTLDVSNNDAVVALDAGATLLVGSMYQGSGELVVNSTQGFSTTRLEVGANGVLDGLVRLNAPVGSAAFARLLAADGSAVIGADGLVVGAGFLGAGFDNRGVIRPGDGNEIEITGELTQSGGGRIVLDAGSAIELQSNGEVVGGRIEGSVGSELRSSSGEVRDVDLIGPLFLPAGARLDWGVGTTLDGELVVNSAQGFNTTRLEIADDASVVGTIRLNAPAGSESFSRLEPEGPGSAIGAGGSVVGSGLISPGFNNRGVIRPGAGNEIEITGELTQSGGGRIVLDAGAAIELQSSGEVVGGRIEGSVGSELRSSSGGEVRGVALIGPIFLPAGARLDWGVGTTLNGELVVNSTQGFNTTRLEVGANAVLDGVVRLNAPSGSESFARLLAEDDSAVIGPDAVVTGAGFLGPDFDNRGVIRPGSGNEIQITGELMQSGGGRIVLDAGAAIELQSSGEVVGGRIEGSVGSELRSSSGGEVRGVALIGPIFLPAGARLDWGVGTTLDGELVVNSTQNFNTATLEIADDASVVGTIRLNAPAGSEAFARLTAEDEIENVVHVIDADARITGSGRIEGPFEVLGTLSPGATSAALANLQLEDEITFAADAVFDLEIAGSNGSDRFVGGSTAMLAGTVVVNQITDDIRSFGDRYEFFRAGSIIGEFDALDADDLPDPLFFDLVYLGDFGVDLLVTCVADVDRSGTLDIDDFSGFVSSFFADEDVADQDANGVLDIDDFSSFVMNFFAGC